jgi:hypothetical protein
MTEIGIIRLRSMLYLVNTVARRSTGLFQSRHELSRVILAASGYGTQATLFPRSNSSLNLGLVSEKPAVGLPHHRVEPRVTTRLGGDIRQMTR